MRNFAFCAERMGRKVKRKMHTMTTFRSGESAKKTCQGLSVIHTASSKAENIFDKLVEIFDRPSPPPSPVPDSGPDEASPDMSDWQPETQQEVPQLYA